MRFTTNTHHRPQNSRVSSGRRCGIGPEAIERCRVEEPAAYVRIVASLLPKEIKVEKSVLGELDDEELARLLDIARAAMGSKDADGPRGLH